MGDVEEEYGVSLAIDNGSGTIEGGCSPTAQAPSHMWKHENERDDKGNERTKRKEQKKAE